jgi:hypothetical protein
VGDAGEGGRERLPGDAGGLRLARELGDEGVEIAAAFRCVGGLGC